MAGRTRMPMRILLPKLKPTRLVAAASDDAAINPEYITKQCVLIGYGYGFPGGMTDASCHM